MTSSKKISRRKFVGTAAAGAAAFSVVPRHVVAGSRGTIAPSDRINLGYIGVGKQSYTLLSSINGCKETLVLAACDVDQKKLDKFQGAATEANKKKVNQEVSKYKYFQDVLGRDDIDAVVIATPDHWHGIIAVEAAKAGKDIYCEKPLSLTVAEGRAMVNATRKYDRVFQTGSMQRSWDDFRKACQLVRNGYIGDIKEVKVEVAGPHKECNLPDMEAPAELDWNLWLGPAMYRAWNPGIAPPFGDDSWGMWRLYKSFGGGFVTDWGAHMFDIAQWGLGMDHSGPVQFMPPENKRADRGVKMKYANGVIVSHEQWTTEASGVQFIGTEGIIEVSRDFLRASNNSILKTKLKETDDHLYVSTNHYQDWVDAIKNRTKPVADVEIGHRTATVCNIINMVYDLERPLLWNPEEERFVGDEGANSLRKYAYRGKWEIEI